MVLGSACWQAVSDEGSSSGRVRCHCESVEPWVLLHSLLYDRLRNGVRASSEVVAIHSLLQPGNIPNLRVLYKQPVHEPVDNHIQAAVPPL